MGSLVDLRFVGRRWEREPLRVLIWLRHVIEGGTNTEASSHGSDPAEELHR